MKDYEKAIADVDEYEEAMDAATEIAQRLVVQAPGILAMLDEHINELETPWWRKVGRGLRRALGS